VTLVVKAMAATHRSNSLFQLLRPHISYERSAMSTTEVETDAMPNITPLRLDEIRELSAAAVARLLRSGAEVRSLYVLVQRLAATCDEELHAIDRLGALLVSWEGHEAGGELEYDDEYWQAIIDLCHKSQEEILELDGLQFGHGEVLLGAIRYAADAHQGSPGATDDTESEKNSSEQLRTGSEGGVKHAYTSL
jgi:hypothetical protein